MLDLVSEKTGETTQKYFRLREVDFELQTLHVRVTLFQHLAETADYIRLMQ